MKENCEKVQDNEYIDFSEHMFRGFSENEDGEAMVLVKGRVYKGFWLDGSLYVSKIEKPHCEYYTTKISDIVYGYDENDCGSYISGYEEHVLPETVCRNTGKKDKTGRTVWEKDVVSICCDKGVSFTGTIKFTNNGFVCVSNNGALANWYNFDIEVIGTAFDIYEDEGAKKDEVKEKNN